MKVFSLFNDVHNVKNIMFFQKRMYIIFYKKIHMSKKSFFHKKKCSLLKYHALLKKKIT